MGLKDLDIVYCLKDKPIHEEFRYSLRSLKNIPHNKVWVYGGCPKWLNLDEVNYVPVVQNKGNKWANTSYLLEKIVQNGNISEDFIWFNDDFFVLKPIDVLPYYYDRTLVNRVNDFRKLRVWHNGYTNRLLVMSRELKWSGKDNLNFELHLPIIFNREKLMKLMKQHPNIAKRSLYGNYYAENPIQRDDVKIYTLTDIPSDSWDFVSTSDDSFSDGKVGKYIKKVFAEKSKYEIERSLFNKLKGKDTNGV